MNCGEAEELRICMTGRFGLLSCFGFELGYDLVQQCILCLFSLESR